MTQFQKRLLLDLTGPSHIAQLRLFFHDNVYCFRSSFAIVLLKKRNWLFYFNCILDSKCDSVLVCAVISLPNGTMGRSVICDCCIY